MSAQAEDTRKHNRRPRKGSRQSPGLAPSQGSSHHDQGLSADGTTNRPPIQPMRILRRGEQDSDFDAALSTESHIMSPQTPPRPRSMYEGIHVVPKTRNDSAPETPQAKKQSSKGQRRKQSGLLSPKENAVRTPISAPLRESSTPNRANATPSKAYAGPAFHASPAASSLPMPRFFSKSVPNVDKTSSLKTMMEQEPLEQISTSEDSISPVDGEFVGRPKTQEESPLDIFFRADREAKGRTESAPNVSGRLLDKVNTVSSPSRPPAPSRNHSHNSFVGGLFPLEMDVTVPEKTSSASCPTDRSNDSLAYSSTNLSSPSNVDAQGDFQRKIQASALKRLLHSPKIQTQSSGETASCQRPSSSKLRKQMSTPNSPDRTVAPELPATPTPFRRHIDSPLAHGVANHNTGYKGSHSPFTSETNPQKDLQLPYSRHTMNTKTMEDDLRRILKISS